MPISGCIRRRLLIASEQSYTIPLPAIGRFADIGWIGEPALCRAEPDLAVIGRIPEGVLVVFRGTRPPFNPRDDAILMTFFDWLNDADCELEAIAPYPGRVHHGFAGSLEKLWPRIVEHADGHFAAGAPKHLLVGGHSKGGALAPLAAWRAQSQWPGTPIRVVTFAAARPGDHKFKQAYEAAAGITTTRYAVQFDVVPDLPPGPDLSPNIATLLRNPPLNRWKLLGSVWDYYPVGTEISDAPSWRQRFGQWLRGFGSLFKGGGGARAVLGAFVLAHFIDPNSDYAKLVCSPGCPHD